VCISNSKGQEVLTFEKARLYAATNSPQAKSAEAYIKKGESALKSSVVLENPVIKYESPTGEFMTWGVDQSFSFPTVYINQKKVAKAQSNAIKNEAKIMLAEAIYKVSSLYHNVQYYTQYRLLLNDRLHILKELAKNNERTYNAGEIDFLTLNNSKNEVHMAELTALKIENQLITNKDELLQYLQLRNENVVLDSFGFYTTIALAIKAQNGSLIHEQAALQQALAEEEVSLAKSQNLPDFFLGYQNQGVRETPYRYRFNIGMELPLYFWQANARVKTAKVNSAFVEARNAMAINEHKIKIVHLKNQLTGLQKTIDFYKNKGLQNTTEMESASKRMYDAGQIPLVHHLENLLRSYDMHIQYIDDVKMYNETILELEYLNAK
jgi:outer membrane protein TolC